jgi:hypothetical protein
MKNLIAAGILGLVAWFGLTGCGDSNNNGGGGSADLSHLTPAEICTQKCERQVAGGCGNMPPDYLESCTLICQAKYRKFPSCAAQANGVDACAIQRVTYACESGIPTVKPQGACAEAALACANCTGDLFECL